MNLELNIGLNTKAGPNEPADVMQRAMLAMRTLSSSLLLGRVASRVQQTSYQGPSGPVTESVLVARAAVRTGELQFVENLAENIAARLEQDCVALLYVGDDGFTGGGETGVLVGPKAEEWGAFNPEFFVRFDDVADATAQEAA